MINLYIPFLILKLNKNETQLLLLLLFIYDSETNKEMYNIDEIAKAADLSKEITIDTLNKLVIRNIIGKIVTKGVITPEIIINFDSDFLATLYDKKNALECAKQNAKFIIIEDDISYLLNPIIKTWRYAPKQHVVKMLKKLKKVAPDNEFIKYLLEGYNNGKKGGKRLNSISHIKGMVPVKDAMEIFREEFKRAYGSTYTPNSRDYGHIKGVITSLAIKTLNRDILRNFFKYAFDKSFTRDYVVQVAGLKYYANEFLASTPISRARN